VTPAEKPAYMAFDDALQTVISVASVFLAQELFVSRGLQTNEAFLMGLVLMVQFGAFGGADLLRADRRRLEHEESNPRVAPHLDGDRRLRVRFLQTVAQAWIMGAILPMVLGGSQALSRSLFLQMIPGGHEAALFGVYELTELGTSWIGPFLFGSWPV